jgi:hypothetical protein
MSDDTERRGRLAFNQHAEDRHTPMDRSALAVHSLRPVRCCVCHGHAIMIVWDRGWHKPSCLTCWPQIDILKHPQTNLPVSGELVYL